MLMNIFFLLIGLVGGGLGGFFIARNMLKKQIKENPPINEKMIRAMFLQMGRKPSETQIKQVMNSMNQYK